MKKQFAMIAMLCAMAAPALAESATPQISVTGQGQIAVAPDMGTSPWVSSKRRAQQPPRWKP